MIMIYFADVATHRGAFVLKVSMASVADEYIHQRTTTSQGDDDDHHNDHDCMIIIMMMITLIYLGGERPHLELWGTLQKSFTNADIHSLIIIIIIWIIGRFWKSAFLCFWNEIKNIFGTECPVLLRHKANHQPNMDSRGNFYPDFTILQISTMDEGGAEQGGTF